MPPKRPDQVLDGLILGAIFGPLASGYLMELVGSRGYFLFLALLFAGLAGYAAWRMHYDLPPLTCAELDPGLLYDALKLGEVDVACGFSTSSCR